VYPLYFQLDRPHTWVNQSACGVSTSYDALLELFERVGNFLKRLHIYTEVPFTPAMTDVIVQIMVEVLSVLSLATKEIKRGRFSEPFLPPKICDFWTFCREIREETIRREQDRICASEASPTY
jgi:hypothetical protein